MVLRKATYSHNAASYIFVATFPFFDDKNCAAEFFNFSLLLFLLTVTSYTSI